MHTRRRRGYVLTLCRSQIQVELSREGKKTAKSKNIVLDLDQLTWGVDDVTWRGANDPIIHDGLRDYFNTIRIHLNSHLALYFFPAMHTSVVVRAHHDKHNYLQKSVLTQERRRWYIVIYMALMILLSIYWLHYSIPHATWCNPNVTYY